MSDVNNTQQPKTETTASSAQQAPKSCCSTAKQAVCCDASDKAACCGTSSDASPRPAGTCGCQ
jgi:hypothetical protein